jgi:CheY-like chemotaxis protein
VGVSEDNQKKRVLVVDDDLLFRELISRLFSTIGCTPEIAADGTEALSKLEGNSFDLVVSDIRMPSMDGLTLLQIMQSRLDLETTPVVLISSEPAHRTATLKAGANLFLDKSQLTLRTVQEMINKLHGTSR